MKIIVLLNEASIWNDIQILFIIPIIKEFNIISNFIPDHYFLLLFQGFRKKTCTNFNYFDFYNRDIARV